VFAILVPTGSSLTLVLRPRNIFIIPKSGGGREYSRQEGQQQALALRSGTLRAGCPPPLPSRVNPSLRAAPRVPRAQVREEAL